MFASGCPTHEQRAKIAASAPDFPIQGTAGHAECYFEGLTGLTRHLSEMGGVMLGFRGDHCEEDGSTLFKAAVLLHYA